MLHIVDEIICTTLPGNPRFGPIESADSSGFVGTNLLLLSASPTAIGAGVQRGGFRQPEDRPAGIDVELTYLVTVHGSAEQQHSLLGEILLCIHETPMIVPDSSRGLAPGTSLQLVIQALPLPMLAALWAGISVPPRASLILMVKGLVLSR